MYVDNGGIRHNCEELGQEFVVFCSGLRIFSDSSARYVSILFQSNRNYSKFCACSGCILTLYLTHMRSCTVPLVYFKFCARIGGFSRATHDWSRG